MQIQDSHEGLWESRVLHELFGQSDPGVVKLVAEFNRLNAAYQLAIESPPVQLAIECPRVVLCDESNILLLEGTQTPLALEWHREDRVPPIGRGGGPDIDCGGGPADFDHGGGHVDLGGGTLGLHLKE